MNHFIQQLFFIFCFIPFTIIPQILQTEDIASQSTYQSTGYKSVTARTNVNAVIIYCTFKTAPDPAYTSYLDSLPYWYSRMGTYIRSYIQTASNSHLNITCTALTHGSKPFIGNYDYTDAPYVVTKEFTNSVLDSVNKYCDLRPYDNDGPDGIPNSGDDDGYVDYVFFAVLWPLDRGGIGLNITYDYGGGDYTTSWPSNKSGFGNIKISGGGHAATQQIIYNEMSPVILHEYGHSLGIGYDIDHVFKTYFNHYSLGSFDVMAHIWGFNKVPSVYNPYFRDELLHWITPTTISSNSTVQLSDLLTSGTVYKYVPAVPSNALESEYYYISYHKGSSVWEQNWPMNSQVGGVLVWRASPNGYLCSNDINNSINYPQIVSLEAAHGRWKWTEGTSNVNNTGVQDALTGFDSLEVRK
jgi:M6 family metalloprotease-like protein